MLRHCLAPSLRDQLNELPKSLDETYERVLKEIQCTNQGRHARRLLHCIAVALRPLRVEELAEVLAFEPNVAKGGIPVFHPEWRWENQEQAVLSACSSLISIVVNDDNTRVIQFSHFSVKEYLTSDRLAMASADVSQYHILPEPAHLMLTHACLGVLLRLDHCVNEESDVDSDKKDRNDIPLLEYAAEHWASHAQVGNISSWLNYAMEILFDPNQPFFLAWIRLPNIPNVDSPVFYGDFRLQDEPMPLYYAALFGFYDIVWHLIIKHPEQVNHFGGSCRSPLIAALSGRHMLVAKLLVNHGAQLHIREDPPLCHVIRFSNDACVDAVRFLLGYGADVNAGDEHLQTPLHVAALIGCPEVAQLLLDHGADVNLQDDQGNLPLHLLSTSRYFEDEAGEDKRYIVAQLLVPHCVDVDTQNMRGATPLHIASSHGKLKIFQLLLDHGANPHAENREGQNSLHMLGVRRKFLSEHLQLQEVLSIAQLLLDHGVDVNSLDKHHTTPLHLILYWKPIIQLLLDHGAQVSVKNALGQTPLHQLSCLHGNDTADVACLFLELGADVNAQDTNQDTPLHFASSFDNFNTALFLLDHGAEIDAQDANGQTPLHQVSCLSSGSVARLLLERGADVNAQSKDKKTPLHSASYESSLQTVQVLLDYGAEADAHDANGQTPLHQVSSSNTHGDDSLHDIAQLLLERGVDVDARDKNQETPLHLACQSVQLRVAKVLLEHGADVNAENVWGWTPLHMALDETFINLLLKQGADVNAQDRNRRTPFYGALRRRDSSIAQVLFENGAEVNVVDIHGQNTLHLLMSQHLLDRVEFAELLLSWGVDMNARDEKERTPLHFASYFGQVNAAELLLNHGAQVEAEDIRGQTPLHQVLLGNRNYQNLYKPFLEEGYSSFSRLAQRLLERGADVNAQNKDHETSLHLASRFRLHDLARILLQYGADVNVKNSEGKSPLQLATGRKGRAMRRLLSAGKV